MIGALTGGGRRWFEGPPKTRRGVGTAPPYGVLLDMWFLTSHFLLFAAGCLVGGIVAWQWRSSRAWRREVTYKREWSDKLHLADQYTNKRLAKARADATAEREARDAKVALLTAEVEELRARLGLDGDEAAPGTEPAPLPMRRSRPAKRPARRRSKRARPGNGSPRTGDDLTRIRGVGPVIERQLRELGYRTFRDIARWGPDDLAKVTRRLEGRGARVEREKWIQQAAQLSRETNASA